MGGTYAALRSGHLAVQLFEMREQAAEVIKDFSRGRLAAECGATEAREAKQQLKKKKKLNRNTRLKASNHVRDAGA